MEEERPVFGKRYLEYFLEAQRDGSKRFGKGIVGKGVYVPKKTTRTIQEGNIIVEVESQEILASVQDGDEPKGLTFRMIFDNEKDAVKFLGFKKGGDKFSFYPNREGEVLEEVVEEKE